MTPNELRVLKIQIQTLSGMDFKTKLEVSNKINRSLEALHQQLLQAEHNLREFGYLPSYRDQYQAQLVSLKTQVEVLRELDPARVGAYFPQEYTEVSDLLRDLD